MDLGADRRGVDMGPRRSGTRDSRNRLRPSASSTSSITATCRSRFPSRRRASVRTRSICRSSCRSATSWPHLVEETLHAGGFPLVLGGDHSIAIGTLAACRARARSARPHLGRRARRHQFGDDLALGKRARHARSFALHERSICRTYSSSSVCATSTRANGSTSKSSACGPFSMSRDRSLRHGPGHGRSARVVGDGPRFGSRFVRHGRHRPDRGPRRRHAVRGGISYREAHLLMERSPSSGALGSLEITEINPILDVNRTAILAVELILCALGKTTSRAASTIRES